RHERAEARGHLRSGVGPVRVGRQGLRRRVRTVRGAHRGDLSSVPMVFHRKVYISAFTRAACSLVAAPPWPPSMFSQERTSAPRDSMAAANLRAWPGWTRSSRVEVSRKVGG